jgi:Helix-turn-helix domain
VAKPFYSIEEVCKLLNKSADDVKTLVRDGALREFRDAGKVFFKADDVDRLAGKARKEGTGEILLEAADDELPTLASTGGTSMIGLAPSEDDPQKKKKEGTVISASGIGVFDDDELEIDADPMAKTTITSGVGDSVSLEGSGSGSGLLDLTRESDDTSLGAELLDEIYPGEEDSAPAPAAKPAKAAKAKATAPVAQAEYDEPAYAASEPSIALPAPVAYGDPFEGLFAGLMAGTLIVLAVAASVVAGGLQGSFPSYARVFSSNFLWFLGGAVLLPIIVAGIGTLVGRSRR